MYEVNLYLDFDHTQVNGHLHNTLIKALKKGDFPDHPDPSQVYRCSEVVDILKDPKKEMPKQVKAWLDRKIEEDKIDFFDSKLLAEKLKEYKGLGIHINVLTASAVPAAIKYMYEKYDLDHLIDRVTSVPTEQPDKKKASHIMERENFVLEKDENTYVTSIFVDDSKRNINTFDEIPLRAGVTRMGILVDQRGLSRDTFDRIDIILKIHKGIYENTPEEIEKAKLEAQMDRGTVYQNTPEEIEKAKLEAQRDRGTVYENTLEEIEKAKLEAQMDRGTVYQNTPEEIERANLEAERTLKEMDIDTPSESTRVSLHFGDTLFNAENLSEKIKGLEYIKSINDSKSESFKTTTQNVMSQMTMSSNVLSAAAEAACFKREKGPTSKSKSTDIKRTGAVRK